MSFRVSSEDWLEVIRHAPLVSIDLIVRDPAGRVLLGWRRNEPARNSWFTVGCAVQKDESLDEAFARLVRGECGIEAHRRNARFIGLYEHRYTTNFRNVPGFGTQYIVLAHELQLPHSEVRGDDQHDRLRWFDEAELMAHPEVHPLVKDYFRPPAS